MPPKRKTQKTPAHSQRSEASAVNVDETDPQSLRETFDVASIPMNEDGANISQQRQMEFRSPAATAVSSTRGGRKGAGATKKAPKKTSSPQDKRPRREEDPVAAPDSEDEAANNDAAAPDAEAAGGSLADNTLDALMSTGIAWTAVESILGVYRRGDQATALCGVLNLVAKAAGVQEVELDANALADGVDISPLLEELYARVPQDSAAYLLVNKESRYRRFRRAFPQFAEQLVKLAWSGDVLLDGILLPTLAQWLLSMSESKSRSFRHTATVMVLGMLQGLNVLYKDLQDRLTLSRTKKESTELEKSMDELARWRDHFFSQAIHQRLRDVAGEIRLNVFETLKGWVLAFPDQYMTNKYLRYFGMPLHDRKPELRAEGLDMIWQALYTKPDAYSRMHLFLQYFIARLVEMTNDVSVRCAELAIRIIAMIVREDSEVAEGHELLQNTMIDRVLLNLFDERPTIRTAAGILLKVFIHCRTAGEDTEEEQVTVATELLCSFASTLRTLYAEKMPEKYLVDALWTPERIPLLLSEYRPMLESAQNAETSTDVLVGLGLLTALLSKVRGRLTLGPLPKDDRKGTAAASKKMPKGTQEAVDDLVQHLSQDLVAALGDILERHRGDQQVLRAVANAVAALDLNALASGTPATALERVMLELRKATMSAPCSEATRDALVAAWHALAFTEHPLRSSAESHLGVLLKQVLEQVNKVQETAAHAAASASPSHSKRNSTAAAAKATEEALNVWARLNLASSLVTTTAQWPIIQTGLSRQLELVARVDAGAAAVMDEQGDEETARVFELLEWMVDTAVNGVLWRVSALQSTIAAAPTVTTALDTDEEAQDKAAKLAATNEAESALRENMTHVVAVLLQCLRAGDGILRHGATTAQAATIASIVSLRSSAAVHLCDLTALRYYDMPQVEQESLVDAFDTLFEYWSAQLRVSQDIVKTAVSQRTENSVLSQVAAARQQCSHMEASQMRLTMGVVRLIALKRLDAATLAPRVLVQWTQTPSKAVADIFKDLFHMLRDRAGDAFHLERDVLLAAYGRCAEVGATPASVDALYQTGTKLASMHFAGTDRFYSSVVAMIQFGAAFATSTDPLLLQGIVPYCNKLHTADALRLVRQELASQDVFMNATNPYVRSFITAMRKAAKLGEFLSSSVSASGAPSQARTASVAGVSVQQRKRTREIVQAVPENEREDHLLAEIARSVSDRAQEGGEGGSHVAAASGAAMTTRSPYQRNGGAKGKAAARAMETERVITEDGWRELPPTASQPLSVPLTPQDAATHSGAEGFRGPMKRRGGARAVVDMPTSQEMAVSSLADGLNTEAFIATEEFE